MGGVTGTVLQRPVGTSKEEETSTGLLSIVGTKVERCVAVERRLTVDICPIRDQLL